MTKRRAAALALTLLVLLPAGCGGRVNPDDLAGRTYVYEKEGAGGSFTLTLAEDGTFQYYEGYLSSYVGMGVWSLEDNVLTLTEGDNGYGWVNRFTAARRGLTFLAEGSDNFLYVKVKDGEKFTPAK